MKTFEDIRETAMRVEEKAKPHYYFYIYRYLASVIAYILQFTKITPNMVSIAAITTTLIGCCLFFFNEPWLYFAGALLLYLGELLDYSDGTHARSINKTSVFTAAFLDDYFHQIPKQFVWMCAGLGAYFLSGSVIHLILGFVITLFQILVQHTSQLRMCVTVKYRSKGFIDERAENNPFTKKSQRWAFDLFVAPFKHIKLVLFGAALISFIDSGFILFLMYVYAPFTVIRFFVFWMNSLVGVKALDAERKG